MLIVLRLPIIFIIPRTYQIKLYNNYIIKACHEIPNQYIRVGIPKKSKHSLVDKSTGGFDCKNVENPNIKFSHDLKKKVGPNKYKKTSRIIDSRGNKSKKNEKKRNSAIKNIEPGKPKNIKLFSSMAKNSLGHIKLIPLTSVISRVLKRLATASTNKNEFVDNNAWLISIQKLASIKLDWPLIIQIVSQCISTTVEYATSFFKSI